jgi:hypothetical protein
MRYGHFVLCQEFNEIIPAYPVMAFGKPECGQTMLFNPVQYRYCTHPALLGNETGGNISGTPVLFSCLQASLLLSILRDFLYLNIFGYLIYLMIFTHQL